MTSTLSIPDYLFKIPIRVPAGQVVVHNHVRPTRRLGSRGFRAWLAEPSDTARGLRLRLGPRARRALPGHGPPMNLETGPLALSVVFRGWQWPLRPGDTVRVYWASDRELLADGGRRSTAVKLFNMNTFLMAARGKATVETYQLGLRLLAMREAGQARRVVGVAPPGAPQSTHRLAVYAVRDAGADGAAVEVAARAGPARASNRGGRARVRHVAMGTGATGPKLPTGLAEMTSTPSRGARKPRTARGAKQTTAPEEGGARCMFISWTSSMSWVDTEEAARSWADGPTPDGRSRATGGAAHRERLYETPTGLAYVVGTSDWPDLPDYAVALSREAALRWLVLNGYDPAERR